MTFFCIEVEAFNQHCSQTDKQKREPAILCSVCIPTYCRPHLLEKLLRSLENQVLPDGVEMEIIIVDNDSLKSAEPVVYTFQDTERIRFCYFNQPIKNISLTRNMAVKKTSGEYILFIDDDEVASPRWLSYLLRTLKGFDADGVFGRVVPEFSTNVPKWMHQMDFFHDSVRATGAKATSKWAGNCIVRAQLLKEMREPFDPKYGITGGEDTHLFDRLEQQGARFVHCQEAWVSEYLPPSRTRLSYLFLRGLRGGNAHTRRKIEFARQKQVEIRIWMVAKALSFALISLIFMMTLYPSPARRTKWLMKLGSNIGRFLAALGWHYKGYR